MRPFQYSSIKLYEHRQVVSIQFVGIFNDQIARKAISRQLPNGVVLGNRIDTVPFEVNDNLTIPGYAVYEVHEYSK